ncbi:NAD(P)-dependent oxidoreductase [Candidatus Rariloculus sp.]|uniref:NAD(P)-dependent oxidoreductase n=1 Tax=Candidatus Rariloculus sp. TaxID=3101265 RepID=UPI003D0960FC
MKIGFIGLGMQGKYLAINLANAGYDLMVFDTRPEPLDELAASGAKIARSCAEVAAHAEIIQVCVLDDAQVEAVVSGPDGLLTSAAPGTIIVVHSTIEPSTIDKLAAVAAEKNVELMDVPVSGSEKGAKNKTMSYMAGGSQAALEKCRPLFEVSGHKIQHVGELGAGMRAKLAHQIIISINMMAAYEGMKVGVESGVDAKILEKVINEGLAQSWIADEWSDLSFGPHSQMVFYKDLHLGLKLAHELGISVPGAGLAQQMLSKIVP